MARQKEGCRQVHGEHARQPLGRHLVDTLTTVDDTGRLVLPPAARDKIDLGAEALFQGKGDQFHILNPEAGKDAEENIEALLASLGGGEFFDPLSLVGQSTNGGE